MSEKNKLSTEDVMTAYLAIIVIPITALMVLILLCFFVVAASPKYQHQAGDSVSPKQEVHHIEDDESDTDELLMWEFFLNEAISNDW